MDFIIEILGELLFEGCFVASNSSKVPKPIRIILGIIIILFYLALVGFLLFMGVSILADNIIGGIIIILFTIVLVGLSVYRFTQLKNKRNK